MAREAARGVDPKGVVRLHDDFYLALDLKLKRMLHQVLDTTVVMCESRTADERKKKRRQVELVNKKRGKQQPAKLGRPPARTKTTEDREQVTVADVDAAAAVFGLDELLCIHKVASVDRRDDVP